MNNFLNEYFWFNFELNNLLNEYFWFNFELNIELNHFLARFNVKMNNQNVSATPSEGSPSPFFLPGGHRWQPLPSLIVWQHCGRKNLHHIRTKPCKWKFKRRSSKNNTVKWYLSKKVPPPQSTGRLKENMSVTLFDSELHCSLHLVASERSETEANMWLWKIELWECCYSNLSTIWIQRAVSDIFQPISEIWHFSHQMCIFWEFKSFREGFFFCLTSAFLEAGFDDQATSFHQTLPTPALVWNVFLKHCKNCKCCPGQVTNIVMSSQL